MAHSSCGNIPSKSVFACRTHSRRCKETGRRYCRLGRGMARKRKRSNKTVAECGRRGRCRSVDGVEVVKHCFWRYNLSWSTRNVAIHAPVLLLRLFTSHSYVAPTRAFLGQDRANDCKYVMLTPDASPVSCSKGGTWGAISKCRFKAHHQN